MPAIPADLETIVHKALEKDATDRYATAKELGHDLQQFLENRPIVARPPSLLQRVGKWSRRHVAAVWIGSLVLLAATIGLGSSLVLISQARDQAVAARRSAESEAQRAKRNLALAIESLDRIYTELVGKHLANEPRLTRVREQFLREALAFYDRIAGENKQDSLSWAETGRAYLVAGRIHTELDQLEEASDAYDKSTAVFDTLIRRFPLEAKFRHQSAEAITEYGSLLTQSGIVEYGLEMLGAAFHVLEPGGDPATEESLAGQLEPPRHADLLATIYQRLGEAQALAGKQGDAEEALRRALRLRRRLAALKPNNADHQRSLAATFARLAMLEHTSGAPAEATQLIDEAMDHQLEATRLAPEDVTSRRALRNYYHALGSIRAGQNAIEPAIEAHQAGFELARALADDYPHIVEDQIGVAFSYFSLASTQLAAGKLDEAESNYHACLHHWQTMPSAMKQPVKLAMRLIGKSPMEAVLAAEESSSDDDAEADASQPESATSTTKIDFEDPDFDPFSMAFDVVIESLEKNDMTKARKLLEQPFLPKAAVSEVTQLAYGNTDLAPLIHLYIQSKELLLGHARALAELGTQLEVARQAPTSSSE